MCKYLMFAVEHGFAYHLLCSYVAPLSSWRRDWIPFGWNGLGADTWSKAESSLMLASSHMWPRPFVWLHLNFWIFPQHHLPIELSHSLRSQRWLSKFVNMPRNHSLFMRGETCKLAPLQFSLSLPSIQAPQAICFPDYGLLLILLFHLSQLN